MHPTAVRLRVFELANELLSLAIFLQQNREPRQPVECHQPRLRTRYSSRSRKARIVAGENPPGRGCKKRHTEDGRGARQKIVKAYQELAAALNDDCSRCPSLFAMCLRRDANAHFESWWPAPDPWSGMQAGFAPQYAEIAGNISNDDGLPILHLVGLGHARALIAEFARNHVASVLSFAIPFVDLKNDSVLEDPFIFFVLHAQCRPPQKSARPQIEPDDPRGVKYNSEQALKLAAILPKPNLMSSESEFLQRALQRLHWLPDNGASRAIHSLRCSLVLPADLQTDVQVFEDMVRNFLRCDYTDHDRSAEDKTRWRELLARLCLLTRQTMELGTHHQQDFSHAAAALFILEWLMGSKPSPKSLQSLNDLPQQTLVPSCVAVLLGLDHSWQGVCKNVGQARFLLETLADRAVAIQQIGFKDTISFLQELVLDSNHEAFKFAYSATDKGLTMRIDEKFLHLDSRDELSWDEGLSERILTSDVSPSTLRQTLNATADCPSEEDELADIVPLPKVESRLLPSRRTTPSKSWTCSSDELGRDQL